MNKLVVDDWKQALVASGVKVNVAGDWAPAFADEWQPDRFSQGMDDIVDLLPQVLHETAMLSRLEENLSYTAARIRELSNASPPGSRWRGLLYRADELAGNPELFAEAVYGGRMGNSQPGWAFKYRGMGPIQFTGRSTYDRLSRLCGQDLDVMPELVLQKRFGLEFTRRWWENEIPDGCLSDQVQVRRRVNGGRIGLDHCIELADTCRRAFA